MHCPTTGKLYDWRHRPSLQSEIVAFLCCNDLISHVNARVPLNQWRVSDHRIISVLTDLCGEVKAVCLWATTCLSSLFCCHRCTGLEFLNSEKLQLFTELKCTLAKFKTNQTLHELSSPRFILSISVSVYGYSWITILSYTYTLFPLGTRCSCYLMKESSTVNSPLSTDARAPLREGVALKDLSLTAYWWGLALLHRRDRERRSGSAIDRIN